MILHPVSQSMIDAACEDHKVTFEQLQGRIRVGPVAAVRQELMFNLVIVAERNVDVVGNILKRCHTTVLWGVRRYAMKLLGVDFNTPIRTIREKYNDHLRSQCPKRDTKQGAEQISAP